MKQAHRNSNKVYALLLFFLLLLSSSLFANNRLPVLVYHHIETNVSSDVSCTPGQFSQHMEALLRANFVPLTLEQARLYLAGCLPLVRRPVLITFDDGYESLYHFALPVAKVFRIPMTVFIITSRIGLKPQFTRYLSGEQIKIMADSGFIEFGSHSHDLHVNILTLFQAFHTTPNPVMRLIADDLSTSKATIEDLLHHPINALAWPYGKHNDALRKIARDCGFQMHFTSEFGFNEPGSDPFAIKRIPVTSRDNAQNILKKLGD